MLRFSLATPQICQNRLWLANLRSDFVILSIPSLDLRRDINKCQVRCHGVVIPLFALHIMVFNF